MRSRNLSVAAVLALTVAAAACSGGSTAPSPVSPAPAAVQSAALPAIWDADPSTGVLPGGIDGDAVFAADTAADPPRIEGRVRAIRGTCPNLGLRIDDQIVRTFARTRFEGQRCTAIAVRDRVVIVGRPIGNDLFGAVRVISRKP